MSAFTDADLKYISDACFDGGARVYEHELPPLIEELENRIGEEPSEDQVIEYAVHEYRRRVEAERTSLAKYSTRGF